jgi:hypothetical protein
MYRYSYTISSQNYVIVSDGVNYWRYNSSTLKWDYLTRDNYTEFGFDYRYYLNNEVIFYMIKDDINIYILILLSHKMVLL